MQQQTIAILGATTKEGVLITTAFAASEHKLLISAGPDIAEAQWMLIDLRKHFPAVDAEAIGCDLTAAWEADIIVAALPAVDLPLVCKKIKEVVNRKIFVVVGEAWNEHVARICTELLPNCNHVFITTEWSGKERAELLHSKFDEAELLISKLLEEAGINPVTNAYNILQQARA